MGDKYVSFPHPLPLNFKSNFGHHAPAPYKLDKEAYVLREQRSKPFGTNLGRGPVELTQCIASYDQSKLNIGAGWNTIASGLASSTSYNPFMLLFHLQSFGIL